MIIQLIKNSTKMKFELFASLFLLLLTSALASQDISQTVINGEEASIEDWEKFIFYSFQHAAVPF